MAWPGVKQQDFSNKQFVYLHWMAQSQLTANQNGV